MPSAGSAENVRRLRYEPGVKFAMVQSDVYQAFLDMAAGGNAEAGAIIRPLRVIMPLYNEEIHFIVRADSDRNYVHEIKNAKINAGELGSGTALTSATLYRLMFGGPMPDASATYFSNEEALVKLITDKSIDVVAVVAGPTRQTACGHEARGPSTYQASQVRSQPSVQQAALKTYVPATVRASNYPNLLAEDLPALAVKAFLVTYDYHLSGRRESLETVRALAMQELLDAARKGAPEVARGRAGSA